MSLKNIDSCTEDSLDILISSLYTEAIYSYTMQSSVLNTYPLDGKAISINMTTVGVYSNGEVSVHDTNGLTCNSSDTMVVKISDCQAVLFDADTTNSDESAVIIVESSSLVSTTVNLLVWYPEQPS